MSAAKTPKTLLPANSTAWERTCSQAMSSTLPQPTPNRHVAHAAAVADQLLYHAEWTLRVDTLWPKTDLDALSAQQRKALLLQAWRLHREKGTLAGIRRIFRILGLGAIEIDEGRSGLHHDATRTHDGFYLHASKHQWAVYRIHCSVLLTAAQAATARRMLAFVAPARCWLYEINFSGAKLIHNSYATHSAAYNHGAYA